MNQSWILNTLLNNDKISGQSAGGWNSRQWEHRQNKVNGLVPTSSSIIVNGVVMSYDGVVWSPDAKLTYKLRSAPKVINSACTGQTRTAIAIKRLYLKNIQHLCNF